MKRKFPLNLLFAAVFAAAVTHPFTMYSANISKLKTKEEKTNMINVLELGVKNDGSEDISKIVNEATKQSALFFPPGIYKVEQPIHLKNSIFGSGYGRTGKSQNITKFQSEINSSETNIGVFNVPTGLPLQIENITIVCSGKESGIHVPECKQSNYLFFDRIAISRVRGYGIYVKGAGSRPVFLNNITIHGALGFPEGSTGIWLDTADNRLSNIEVMGCQIALELHKGFNYGSNLHLWTGCLDGKDNGKWWRGTRSVVLDKGAMFNASNIYPDTSFYAFESKDKRCTFHISNIYYYEDSSTGGSPDFDGEFFHNSGDFQSVFHVTGGEINLQVKLEKNGRMRSVYTPGTRISNVLLKNDMPVCKENFYQLILDDTLPDYEVRYNETGLCKVADFVMAEDYGYIEADVTMEDGAAYKVKFYRKKGGDLKTEFAPANPLAEETVPLKIRKVNDSTYGLYYKKDSAGKEAIRFTTKSMGKTFRPIHYGSLRTGSNTDKYPEVITE